MAEQNSVLDDGRFEGGKGYEIVKLFDRAICYTVDLSATKTPDT